MTIEDFRPCVCGHAKHLHAWVDGRPECLHGRDKDTSVVCGNGVCVCLDFFPAVEPYIDIQIKSEWYEGSTIEWGGIEPEKVSCVNHGRSTTLTVRLRPSDIAFADWKRKQAR